METQSTFELNAAVGRWRETVAVVPALRGRDIDELEGHLRDAVADLIRRGLSEEEAFLISARRLGSPAALAEEFGKVHPDRVWLERVLWIVLGTLGLGIITSVSNLAGDLAWAALLRVSSKGWLAGAVFTVTSLAVYAGLCVLAFRELRQEGERVRWLRAAFRGRPFRTALVLTVCATGSSLLNGWGIRLGFGVVSPETFHQAMQWRTYGAIAAFWLGLPSILVWLLVRYQRTLEAADSVGAASELGPG